MPTVSVPIPPSSNHLWRAVSARNGRLRVIKEKSYAGWIAPAVLLMRAGLPVFPGRVRVSVLIRGGKGFSERRDLDNSIKSLIDALRHAGRIPEDNVRVVAEVSARYEPPARKGDQAACLVTVEGVSGG